MYRLLIADDEKTTRESLHDLIPWGEWGISEVVIAKNGLEALQIARQTHPDILLTDIRMPKMDGLELAKNIREEYPQCQIIFLSGYADKAYLKTAIHLKAVSYIEKPINPEEIREVIRETVMLCNNEAQRTQILAKLQYNHHDSQPLLHQALLLQLIHDQTNAAAFAKCETAGVRLEPEACYTVTCIKLFWDAYLENLTIDQAQRQMLTALTATAGSEFSLSLAGFDPDGNLIVVFPGKLTAASAEPLHLLLREVAAIAPEKFSYAAGVGGFVHGPDRIPESYRTAVSSCAYSFYSPGQKIFFHDELQWDCGAALELNKNLFTEVKMLLREDRFEPAQTLIRELTAQIRQHRESDLDRIKNTYFHLWMVIYEVALERGLIDPFDNREESYFWKEIAAPKNLEELSGYVLTNMDMLFNRLAHTDAVMRKVEEITHFIRRHYADNTLSIPSIGAAVYLSPTYLCAFFKKNTGKTLNEFITALRISQAQELLKQDSRLKLYEIASRVGFTDVNYFSSLFKRCVGHTPSDYREKYCR